MSKSIVVVLVLTAVVACFGLSATGPRADEKAAPPVQKWEYAIVSKDVGEFQTGKVNPWLVEQGQAGWELCDCVRSGQSLQCIFKRAKH